MEEGAGNKKLSAFVHGEVLGHIDSGDEQYGGPCPPPGPAHHYHFTVYALDTDRLPLHSSATGALVEFQMADHTLARATIIGFARERSARIALLLFPARYDILNERVALTDA